MLSNTKYLVIDVEGPLDGHPFAPQHRLSIIGLFDGTTYSVYDIEHSGHPYGQVLQEIQLLVDSADVLIAFNSKYDLHWLRRYGIKFHHKKLWCLQYAEFCMSGQQWPYPDLDTACKNRGLEGKSNYIWDTYWSKGIATTSIPLQELIDYNKIDLKIEWNLFQKQVEILQGEPQLKKLIWYGSQDLLVTEEMEWNGLKYDTKKSLALGDSFLAEISEISIHLSTLVHPIPINWGSPQQLSAVLYGGTINEEVKEPFTFVYKDGRTREKLRTVIKTHNLPQLVAPLKGTKNTNGYSTDEGVLKKLRATGQAKTVISLLLRKRELDKKVGTYYHGIPKLIGEKQWEENVIHGQLNHCRASSGRLASMKPNLQNIEYGVRECITTRFPLISTPATS
jgi:DNA polymerase I-like protein with 3'-5' exonuclease and polymerase domains